MFYAGGTAAGDAGHAEGQHQYSSRGPWVCGGPAGRDDGARHTAVGHVEWGSRVVLCISRLQVLIGKLSRLQPVLRRSQHAEMEVDCGCVGSTGGSV
jgi:hypothetical protein